MIGEASLTRDQFLNGRVTAWQPRKGFRAGSDSVLLAAACPAQAGKSVLELGSGVGVVSLCLAARVPGLKITAVERDRDMAVLAQRNVAENGFAMDVVTADVTALPAELKAQQFDHVLANPPYFRSGTQAPDAARAVARHEHTPLAAWVEVAARRLLIGGTLVMILQADRLADLLKELGDGFGDIAIRPIMARAGREAGRILVNAKRGARAPLRLLAPLVMHDGEKHAPSDYSATARSILRGGNALDW